jgi:hypothetical protein
MRSILLSSDILLYSIYVESVDKINCGIITLEFQVHGQLVQGPRVNTLKFSRKFVPKMLDFLNIFIIYTANSVYQHNTKGC